MRIELTLSAPQADVLTIELRSPRLAPYTGCNALVQTLYTSDTCTEFGGRLDNRKPCFHTHRLAGESSTLLVNLPCGGEGGIRTHGAFTHWFSRPARSAALTPLLIVVGLARFELARVFTLRRV